MNNSVWCSSRSLHYHGMQHNRLVNVHRQEEKDWRHHTIVLSVRLVKAAKLFYSMSRAISNDASYKFLSVKICNELNFLILKTCKNNSIAECRSSLEKRLVGTERFSELLRNAHLGPRVAGTIRWRHPSNRKYGGIAQILQDTGCAVRNISKKILRKSSSHQRQPDIPYYGGNLAGLRMDKAFVLWPRPTIAKNYG